MTEETPDNAARATPVAWAMTDYQADGANTQYTRDSHAAEYWGSQGIQIDPLFDAATVAALEAEVERLVKALDEAACELSAAGQALAEFEGFEFRQKAAMDRAYAASQKAHDANGYTEVLRQEKPE